jgi:hypothetical protein
MSNQVPLIPLPVVNQVAVNQPADRYPVPFLVDFVGGNQPDIEYVPYQHGVIPPPQSAAMTARYRARVPSAAMLAFERERWDRVNEMRIAEDAEALRHYLSLDANNINILNDPNQLPPLIYRTDTYPTPPRP